MNWKKYTNQELYEIAEWAYKIGMHHLAKVLLQEINRSGSSK